MRQCFEAPPTKHPPLSIPAKNCWRVLLPSSLGRASLFKLNSLLGHLSPLAGQIQIHQPLGRIGDNDRRSLAFHCFASAGFRTFVHAIETKGSVMEFLGQATTLERFEPRDPG